MSAPFTRTELARDVDLGGQFKELRDVKWINPREFHRKALADIEDLGYAVHRGLTEGIHIEREAIGEKTGHVVSWAFGHKDLTVQGSVTWGPYQLVGVLLAGAGVVAALLGFQVPLALLLALALLGSGIALALYKKTDLFLMHGLLNLRLLAQGEATERTIQRSGANVTDLFAQLTVTYAFVQRVEIRAHEIANPALRTHLENLVRKRMASFPQLQAAAGLRSPSAFTAWPVLHAPTATFLTSDAQQLLKTQANLIGPDLKHLTDMISRYNVTIASVTTDGTIQTVA